MPLPVRTTTVQPDPALAADHDEAGARLADAMRERYGPDWRAARSEHPAEHSPTEQPA